MYTSPAYYKFKNGKCQACTRDICGENRCCLYDIGMGGECVERGYRTSDRKWLCA